MTKLLLRLFIKNRDDLSSPAVRARIGKLAGYVGIACNLLLAVLKITVGFLIGSVSITADGLNNLSDTASSAVAIVGYHLAQHPADKDHPYGHGRFEYLSSLGIAVVILFVGVELIKTAIEKIVTPIPMNLSTIAILVLIASILLKLWMYLFFGTLGRRTASSVLLAAAADSRNDVLATAAILAGCIIYRCFDLNLDGYIGLAVAIFILVSGFRIAGETVSPLLGRRADTALTEGLTALLLSEERILGIHDLLVHDYGPGQCYASVHAELSASEDPIGCHALIDRIEAEALSALNVHLVIHYDPVSENDEEQNLMRATVDRLLAEIDPRLSIHDFRIVHTGHGATLRFDISLPYTMLGQEEEIREDLDAALLTAGYRYTMHIRFDGC